MADDEPQKWIEAEKRKLQPQAIDVPTLPITTTPDLPGEGKPLTDMVIDPKTGKYRQVTMGPGTTAKGAWYYSDTGQKFTSGKD